VQVQRIEQMGGSMTQEQAQQLVEMNNEFMVDADSLYADDVLRATMAELDIAERELLIGDYHGELDFMWEIQISGRPARLVQYGASGLVAIFKVGG
jgi:hypothetical protein